MSVLTAPHQSIKTDSLMEHELHEYLSKKFIGQTVAEALKLMMLNLIAGKHLALSVDYIPYSSKFDMYWWHILRYTVQNHKRSYFGLCF